MEPSARRLTVVDRDGAPDIDQHHGAGELAGACQVFRAPPSVSAFGCCSVVSGRRGCNGNAWSDGVDRPRYLDGDVSSVTLARSRRLALSTPAHRPLRGGYLCNFKVILILNRLTA